MRTSMKQIFIFLSIIFYQYSYADKLKKEEYEYIDVAKIKMVSYLLASESGIGRSTFGHAYLRFSYEENLRPNDIIVEFVADENPSKISALKGIGLTFGSNYGFATNSSSYKKAYKFHVLKEDRDLTSFVLNISVDKARLIATEVNHILNNGLNMTYSFFARNCASVVSLIFENSLQINSSNFLMNIPIFIPEKLKKLDLVRSTHIDLRVSKLREKVVNDEFNQMDLNLKSFVETYNLREQLSSKKINDRILGLYKLNEFRLSSKCPRKYSNTLRSLGAKLLNYENLIVNENMNKLFNGTHRSFKNFHMSPLKTRFEHVKKIKKIYFSTNKEKVYLNIDLKLEVPYEETSSRKFIREKILVSDFRYKDGEIRNADGDGDVIAFRLNNNISEKEFYSPNLYYNAEILKKENDTYIYPIILWELKNHPNELTFNKEKMISIPNGESGVGYCMSHSELVMALNTNVIYDQTGDKLREEEYLKILEDLDKGKIIVAPGVSSPLEFTKQISSEKLSAFLIKKQNEKRNFLNSSVNWFYETNINNENFYILKNLIRLGINPIIGFEVEGRKNVGHSLIVTEIFPVKEDYKVFVSAIDSNKSIGNQIVKGQYWYNLKTQKLHTLDYGIVDIKLPDLDVDAYRNRDLIIKNRALLKKVIDTSREKRIFSFWVSDFL